MNVSSNIRENRKEINSILVVGYDPSHSKSAQVSLQLKILSTLARSAEHEKKMERQNMNQHLNANQLSKMYFLEHQNGERLETMIEEEEDDDEDFGDFNSEEDFQLDVQMRAGDLHNDARLYNMK